MLVCTNNGMESKLGCGMQDESYLEVVVLGKIETCRGGQIVKKRFYIIILYLIKIRQQNCKSINHHRWIKDMIYFPSVESKCYYTMIYKSYLK